MIRVLHTGLRLPEKRDKILLTHKPALVSGMINLEPKLVERELVDAEAISFFSPRAVQSVFDQGIELPDIPVFVVGTKTQKSVLEKYGRSVERFETFSAFSESKVDKKLVSFELRESRHSVKKLDSGHVVFSCYETKSRTISVSEVERFDWIIITSPRGADSFFSQVSLQNFSGNFACLGKTTYEALQDKHDVEAVFEREGSVSVDCLLDRIEGI